MSEDNPIEFLMRVKLPRDMSLDKCRDENAGYMDARFLDAIFKDKPDGFEVDWGSRDWWPVDNNGFTWVKLYMTSHKSGIVWHMTQYQFIRKRIERMQDIAKQLI